MKRLLLLIAFVLFSSQAAFAAVAKNDSGTAFGSNNSTNTITLSTFTVSAGSNLCIVGLLSIDGNPTGVTMTWNGVSMTAQATATTGSAAYAGIFVLPAPAAGNHDLVASWTNAGAVTLGAIAFSGADQSTCVNASDNQSLANTASGITLSVPTSSDGATVAVSRDSGGSYATGTEIFTVDTYRSATYIIGGTGTNAHTWNSFGGFTDQAEAGVHVIAASGGATAPSGMLLRGVQ